MSISLKTHKILWAKSGNKCAFPNCEHNLVYEEFQEDLNSVIGEEAHIIARQPGGPRNNNQFFDQDELNKLNNLILLCRIHHKIIDDNEDKYTTEILKAYKSDHEKWVREKLDYNEDELENDLIYITAIENIQNWLELDNWISWTMDFIYSELNVLPRKIFYSFRDIRIHIQSRIWPNKYQEIEFALKNMKDLIYDLEMIYSMHMEERWTDKFQTSKYYKQYAIFNHDRYEKSK